MPLRVTMDAVQCVSIIKKISLCTALSTEADEVILSVSLQLQQLFPKF